MVAAKLNKSKNDKNNLSSENMHEPMTNISIILTLITDIKQGPSGMTDEPTDTKSSAEMAAACQTKGLVSSNSKSRLTRGMRCTTQFRTVTVKQKSAELNKLTKQ